MQLLRRAIRREQLLKLCFSLALGMAGFAMAYAFFQYSALLTILGLGCAVLGILYTRRALAQRRVDDSRLMRLLRYQPGQVAWVYSILTERLPFGLKVGSSCTLYFRLLDGGEISVGMPARDVRVVSRLLTRLLPHASFGYTKDREQWYLANPELLLRSGEEEN